MIQPAASSLLVAAPARSSPPSMGAGGTFALPGDHGGAASLALAGSGDRHDAAAPGKALPIDLTLAAWPPAAPTAGAAATGPMLAPVPADDTPAVETPLTIDPTLVAPMPAAAVPSPVVAKAAATITPSPVAELPPTEPEPVTSKTSSRPRKAVDDRRRTPNDDATRTADVSAPDTIVAAGSAITPSYDHTAEPRTSESPTADRRPTINGALGAAMPSVQAIAPAPPIDAPADASPPVAAIKSVATASLPTATVPAATSPARLPAFLPPTADTGGAPLPTQPATPPLSDDAPAPATMSIATRLNDRRPESSVSEPVADIAPPQSSATRREAALPAAVQTTIARALASSATARTMPGTASPVAPTLTAPMTLPAHWQRTDAVGEMAIPAASVAAAPAAPALPTSPARTPAVPTPVTTADAATERSTAQTQPVAATVPLVSSLPLVVPLTPAAPAAIVFGAARFAAQVADDRDDPKAPPGLVPLAGPQAIERAVAGSTITQAPLDLRQEHWPHAMIERIEMIRDAADAADTRIRLIPDALGAIDVEVKRDGDTLNVRFHAEQAQTRTLLAEAAPRLAEAAEARGMRLGQSSVGADAGSAGQGQQRQPLPNAAPRAPVSTVADAPVDDDTRLA